LRDLRPDKHLPPSPTYEGPLVSQVVPELEGQSFPFQCCLAPPKTSSISSFPQKWKSTKSLWAPPYSGGAPDDLEPYPHDPEEARRLLSEVSWPEGRAVKLASTSDVTVVAERLARDFRDSLGIEVEMIEIPDEDLIAAQKTLVEKNLPLPFDVLVHAWFDLAAGYPPAVVHREYFHTPGAFRAGPPVSEFEELIARSVVETDTQKLTEPGKQIDRLVYDDALSVFLCCPMALVAVNRYVEFTGHAATLELAETEVTEEHWSRTWVLGYRQWRPLVFPTDRRHQRIRRCGSRAGVAAPQRTVGALREPPTPEPPYRLARGLPKSDLRVSSSISSSDRRRSLPTLRAPTTAGRDSMFSYQRFTFG
jgi:hypothetical protein